METKNLNTKYCVGLGEILFQESETFLEIRDFSTIGMHWGLAENGDANQPEYHYKKQLPQNQKILLLT